MAWTSRLLDVVADFGFLFDLLESIGEQIDNDQGENLKPMCEVALQLWNEHQAVLSAAPVDRRTLRRWERQTTGLDRAVTLILETGASGAEPSEIRIRLLASQVPVGMR
jgi:hypothetical protein